MIVAQQFGKFVKRFWLDVDMPQEQQYLIFAGRVVMTNLMNCATPVAESQDFPIQNCSMNISRNSS